MIHIIIRYHMHWMPTSYPNYLIILTPMQQTGMLPQILQQHQGTLSDAVAP